MDHDQEKFYTDEELDSREDVQPEEEQEIDDMSYFLELLKLLRTAIECGSRIPLSSKVVIDANNCLKIVDDLESNLPDAVQYGMQMYSERKRIMGDAEETAISRVTSAEMRANAVLEKARKDAEQMVQDAQERADHMIDESEIVRQAREEARTIKNDARIEASELRLKANHDAYQLLAGVEDELTEACKTLRRRRAELGDEAE